MPSFWWGAATYGFLSPVGLAAADAYGARDAARLGPRGRPCQPAHLAMVALFSFLLMLGGALVVLPYLGSEAEVRDLAFGYWIAFAVAMAMNAGNIALKGF